MSLRSVLGGSRIKKKKSAARSSATTDQARRSPGLSSTLPSWRRTKPAVDDRGEKQDYNWPSGDCGAGQFVDGLNGYDASEQLPDYGLVRILADDPSLRDVAQAMRHSQLHMFDPVLDSSRSATVGPATIAAGSRGMSSERVSLTLRFRASLPPVVSTSHVQAILAAAGPTAVERETDELVRAGVLRRVIVARRGAVGDALVFASDLEAMVRGSAAQLNNEAKEIFISWLRQNPCATRMPRSFRVKIGDASGKVLELSHKHTDQLIRAGFLTSQQPGHDSRAGAMAAYSRPEQRHSLVSLETVSQAASGSMAAVGGQGALYVTGGSGAGGGFAIGSGDDSGDLVLAVPGHGAYLKLVSSGLEHIASLLEGFMYRESPISVLREKWEGGIGRDEASLAKRSRGEFVGVLPGRTRKWKDFYGLNFDWILLEAVGTGLVEVFETRSVGRAVRLIQA
ncbi:hypothetical protein VTK73DRAFT_8882 [Phialemonium thermophilum]|uniref:Serine-threonine protein kinase 19 n=1 Tax=Phialemonium thermophilum TaxID=223376 RepID=A0ABR3XM62_9PEZI